MSLKPKHQVNYITKLLQHQDIITDKVHKHITEENPLIVAIGKKMEKTNKQKNKEEQDRIKYLNELKWK